MTNHDFEISGLPTYLHTEPGASTGPFPPRAADLDGGGAISGAPVPFLLSAAFSHADSRPTPYEWLCAKRIERGAVRPFVHSPIIASPEF